MQPTKDELLQAMYEEYQRVLCKIALNSGVPYGDVDDIVQETFLAYYNHYPLDWEPNQKKAMLTRIVKNKSIDYFRKNGHIDYVSMDYEEYKTEREVLTKCVMKDTLDCILEDESCRELQEAIKHMKKDWSDLALLLFVEGREVSEVCQILDISEAACRMRMSRIRKYLKGWLKRHR